LIVDYCMLQTFESRSFLDIRSVSRSFEENDAELAAFAPLELVRASFFFKFNPSFHVL